MAVTAPQICPECGAFLDAGEQCDCKEKERDAANINAQTKFNKVIVPERKRLCKQI